MSLLGAAGPDSEFSWRLNVKAAQELDPLCPASIPTVPKRE